MVKFGNLSRFMNKFIFIFIKNNERDNDKIINFYERDKEKETRIR